MASTQVPAGGEHASLAGFTPLGLAIPRRDCPEEGLSALVRAMAPEALTVVADVTGKTLYPRNERDTSNTFEAPEALSNYGSGPRRFCNSCESS